MSKKVILTVLTLTVLTAGVLTSTKIFAQETGQDRITSLVQKIAEKFGLNKNDVQAVFDQDRQERQAQRESEYEAQLNQYVKDGKITEAQKQLILTKHKELEAKRDADFQNRQNQTPEQRRTEMNAERTDLENWAKQNGIDLQYVIGLGKMNHHGFGMRGGFYGGPSPTPASK